MSRTELEGRLGITFTKVEDLLERAEQKTMSMSSKRSQKGEIKYKAFIGACVLSSLKSSVIYDVWRCGFECHVD